MYKTLNIKNFKMNFKAEIKQILKSSEKWKLSVLQFSDKDANLLLDPLEENVFWLFGNVKLLSQRAG